MLVPARQRRPEVGMLLLATLLLAFGVLVYVLDRGGAVYFLSTWTATLGESNVFGPLGDHLPTFVHTLAFILITAAILRPWPRQLPQGSVMTRPLPRHLGQVCWTWKKPCCMRTWPTPPQVPHEVL